MSTLPWHAPDRVRALLAADALRQYEILQDVHAFARQGAFEAEEESDSEDAVPTS